MGVGCVLVPGMLSSVVSLLGAVEGGALTHTVQSGDTLSGIATRFGVKLDDLRALNQLKNDKILVGQVLQIPTAEVTRLVHVVKQGDTLSGIAQQYGVTLKDIRNANHLSGDTIRIGQELVIERKGTRTENRYRYIQEVVELSPKLRIERNRWRWIVGHHSGIARGNAARYDRAHREDRHMANGLAYHFVIGNGVDSGNGEVEIGGRWKQQIQGGHVRSHQVNLAGIGICMVGNFQETRPSTQQMDAFVELVSYLKNDLLGSSAVRFSVHREIDRNHTVCPGKNFPIKEMHQMFG
jgi:LysM repeat protein